MRADNHTQTWDCFTVPAAGSYDPYTVEHFHPDPEEHELTAELTVVWLMVNM